MGHWIYWLRSPPRPSYCFPPNNTSHHLPTNYSLLFKYICNDNVEQYSIWQISALSHLWNPAWKNAENLHLDQLYGIYIWRRRGGVRFDNLPIKHSSIPHRTPSQNLYNMPLTRFIKLIQCMWFIQSQILPISLISSNSWIHPIKIARFAQFTEFTQFTQFTRFVQRSLSIAVEFNVFVSEAWEQVVEV